MYVCCGVNVKYEYELKIKLNEINLIEFQNSRTMKSQSCTVVICLTKKFDTRIAIIRRLN